MLCWPKVYHRVWMITRCPLPLPLILKMTLPLSVWLGDSWEKKEKKYHSKQRSLVLRIPAAWGFFCTLTPCTKWKNTTFPPARLEEKSTATALKKPLNKGILRKKREKKTISFLHRSPKTRLWKSRKSEKKKYLFWFLTRAFLLLKKKKKRKNIILGAVNATGGYAQTNCHFWAFWGSMRL